LLLLGLALGACSVAEENPYHASNQQRVLGDGASVLITQVKSQSEAQPFADDYCRRYGGAARFKGMMQHRVHRTVLEAASFECVQASSSQATSPPA
jgi:hypothetical protein